MILGRCGVSPLEGGVLKTDCFKLVEVRGKAFPHKKLFQKRRLHRPILAAKKRIKLYLETVKIA